MLYYQTIDLPTLELLKSLQQIPNFSNLRLAGGTALALQLGHRKSIDLDLFGAINIDELSLSKSLAGFGNPTLLNKSENIYIYLLNGIKVDIVNYHYPWLEKEILLDKITLAGKIDIAAMKLAAITGRGTKKDFIDIYFLLQHFSLAEMLDFYRRKYSDGSEFLVLKSLSYFDDADNDVSPLMIVQTPWKDIKEAIMKLLTKYIEESHISSSTM